MPGMSGFSMEIAENILDSFREFLNNTNGWKDDRHEYLLHHLTSLFGTKELAIIAFYRLLRTMKDMDAEYVKALFQVQAAQ